MKTILKTTLFTTLLISSALTAMHDPFAAPATTGKKSKYAVIVAPIPTVVLNPAEKTIQQHKNDGAAGFHILADNEIAGLTDDLTGGHSHFTKLHVQSLVTAEETAKIAAVEKANGLERKVTDLLDLIAELKVTHGSTVNSAPSTADGTLDGMLNAAKVGAGNITLTDNSVVNVATAGNADLIAILTGADLNDKEALLVALRAAPAWTHDAGEEDDLTKTIYLRSVINR